jgi:hypothetical protein
MHLDGALTNLLTGYQRELEGKHIYDLVLLDKPRISTRKYGTASRPAY